MDYHNEVMRIHCDPESDYDYTGNKKIAYKEGHRDARHAAAEIALDAEAEIEALRGALDEIANPVKYMEAALAPDERLCGQTAASLSSDPQYLKEIASRALAAHDKGGRSDGD